MIRQIMIAACCAALMGCASEVERYHSATHYKWTDAAEIESTALHLLPEDIWVVDAPHIATGYRSLGSGSYHLRALVKDGQVIEHMLMAKVWIDNSYNRPRHVFIRGFGRLDTIQEQGRVRSLDGQSRSMWLTNIIAPINAALLDHALQNGELVTEIEDAYKLRLPKSYVQAYLSAVEKALQKEAATRNAESAD